jgi:hypothetical protein
MASIGAGLNAAGGGTTAPKTGNPLTPTANAMQRIGAGLNAAGGGVAQQPTAANPVMPIATPPLQVGMTLDGTGQMPGATPAHMSFLQTLTKKLQGN